MLFFRLEYWLVYYIIGVAVKNLFFVRNGFFVNILSSNNLKTTKLSTCPRVAILPRSYLRRWPSWWCFSDRYWWRSRWNNPRYSRPSWTCIRFLSTWTPPRSICRRPARAIRRGISAFVWSVPDLSFRFCLREQKWKNPLKVRTRKMSNPERS